MSPMLALALIRAAVAGFASNLACSSDGWCVVLPSPIEARHIAADGGRMVAGSEGGVLALWDGGWRDGIDTGLERLEVLAWERDGVVACDDTRCVRVEVSDTLGPVVPDPRTPSDAPVRARSGDEWTLRDGVLRVDGATMPGLGRGQAVQDALGGSGETLWVTWGATIARRSPSGTIERTEIAPGPLSASYGGRLAGDPDRPFAIFYGHAGHALLRWDGSRWVHLEQAAGVFAAESVFEGAGCAPCVLGPGGVLWRDESGWEVAALGPGESDAVAVQDGRPIVRTEGRALRIGTAGPTEAAPPEAWAEAVPRRFCDDDRTEALSTGALARLEGPHLRVDGRIERLPHRPSACSLFETGRGLLLLGHAWGWHLLERTWDRVSAPEGEPWQGRVVGVAADDVLNVRAGPSWRAPRVGQLPPNGAVAVVGGRLGSARAGWVPVRLADGTRGWVAGRYVTRESP